MPHEPQLRVMAMPAKLWLHVQWALETHGWKLLGAALLLYVGRQHYREYAARRHQQRALAAANDPARVAVLQRETARVRHKQQQQLQAKKAKPHAKVKVEKAA